MESDPADFEHLVDRDVSEAYLPEQVYALGGAGKKIALRLLEQDWFLVEAMRPDETTSPVQFTIVDTATENRQSEEERVDDVRERVDEIYGRMRERYGTDVRNLSVELVYIPDRINVSNVADFVSPDVRDRITSNTDAEEWWVEEDHLRDSEADMLNFKRGVIRRRALSKAFYYKALAEDLRFRDAFDLTNQDEKIALIAGLGGGTGSGIAIDLARHLRDSSDAIKITLFGVLPNPAENSDVKANAYAALSELERVTLGDGEDPFDNVVLSPIDPTEHSGSPNNAKLLQFDDAFAYTLLTYYNGIQNKFGGTTSFAPFTMAAPQVLRYNVEAISRARDHADELLDTKEEAIDAEADLHGAIRSFLAEHYEEPTDAELNQRDESWLRSRIDRFEDLVEFPLFDQLEYASIAFGREVIENLESDDLDAAMREIEFQLTTRGDAVDATAAEDMDERLEDVLIEDLKRIHELYELLKFRKAVDSDHVNRMIGFLLNPDLDKREGRQRFSTLEGRLDEAVAERDEFEADLAEVEDELERRRAEHEDERRERVAEWSAAAGPHLERLATLSDVDVADPVNDLGRELSEFAFELERAESENEVDEVEADVEEPLDAIEDELADADVDVGDVRADVEQSMEKLRTARERWLEINGDSGGIVDSLFGGGDDARDAEDVYAAQRADLADLGVFSVPAPDAMSFTVQVTYDEQDVVARVEDAREGAVEGVVDAFEAAVEDADDGAARREAFAERVEELVDEGATDLESRLEPVVEEEVAAVVGEDDDLRQRREQREADLDAAERRVARLEAASDLFEDSWPLQRTFTERQAEFVSAIESGGPDADADATDEGIYIDRVEPNDLISTIDKDGLAEARLFAPGNDEQQRVMAHFDRVVNQRLSRSAYNGLEVPTLSTNVKFDDTRLNVGVVSPALDESGDRASDLHPSDLDYEHLLMDNFSLDRASGDDTYNQWYRSNGGPWDVAMVLFVQGISFLDNIRNVSAGGSGGYKGAYERKLGSDSDVALRHSLDLERGRYGYRRDLVNLKSDPEFFLRDDHDAIREDVLDRHEVVEDEGADEPDRTEAEPDAEAASND